MKLFGGGKQSSTAKPGDAHKDEDASYFDSPSETVSLSAPAPKREASVVIEAEAEPAPTTHYGIDQAIQLMRSLPIDQNTALVVTVIKTTLESLKVRVPDIIADASRKQADLEKRVETLSKEITDFEKEISQRRDEIARLEEDHRETTRAKERLELAEREGSDAKKAGGKAEGAKAEAAKADTVRAEPVKPESAKAGP